MLLSPPPSAVLAEHPSIPPTPPTRPWESQAAQTNEAPVGARVQTQQPGWSSRSRQNLREGVLNTVDGTITGVGEEMGWGGGGGGFYSEFIGIRFLL